MTKPTANLRLFVAVWPPLEVAEALLARLRGLELPRRRAVAPEQMHMTLQFIGDTPARDMDAVTESVLRSASGLEAFDLTALRLVTFPEKGRARLVAVETDAPATLLELKRRLALRLASHMRGRPDQRFRPHLTLCRFPAPVAMDPLDEAVGPSAFRVDRCTLVRSVLHSGGAEYHAVAEARLGE